MTKKIIATVIGARPQFVKAFPFHHQIGTSELFREIIIHTGQHYDYEMSQLFFEELRLPKPDHHLGIGSGSHAVQTGQMLRSLETILLREKPDLVMVYGDTNSTLAGALTAAKLCFPLAHVEAGLRSFNRRMPEEVNRVVTDHLSQVLFCPTEQGLKNLAQEGFTITTNTGQKRGLTLNDRYVFAVQDIMREAMHLSLPLAENKKHILKELGIRKKEYILVTAHRAENVDDPDRLRKLIDILNTVAETHQVVFPIHPRTEKQLKSCSIEPSSRIRIIKPIGYLTMIFLEKNARAIMTDSGGVQKEAFWLDVPCLTMRTETEWIEMVKRGGNHLVDLDKERILSLLNETCEEHQVQNIQHPDTASFEMLTVLAELMGSD